MSRPGGSGSGEQHPGDAAPNRRSSGGETVAEITSRLRLCEDYNMALALQEKEYSQHYDQNRAVRRISAIDHKKSKEEHLEEQRIALQRRMAVASEIARQDEEMARSIQRALEVEEQRRQMDQAAIDEELARRLQLEEMSAEQRRRPGPDAPSSSTHFPVENGSPPRALDDEELARNLQERYYQRFNRKPGRPLDASTQNQLNMIVDSNSVHLCRPTAIGIGAFPPLPSYAECMSTSSSGRGPTSPADINTLLFSSNMDDPTPPMSSFAPIANLPSSTSSFTAPSATATTTNLPLQDLIVDLSDGNDESATNANIASTSRQNNNQ